eukprot:scaffold8.g1720.t1
MAFLLKRQADVLTIDDVKAAPNQTLAVTGIKAPAAKKVIETMQPGDIIFLFESGHDREGPYPDPEMDNMLAFDIKLTVSLLDKPLHDWTLFTQTGLPVHHVPRAMEEHLFDMVGEEEGGEG